MIVINNNRNDIVQPPACEKVRFILSIINVSLGKTETNGYMIGYDVREVDVHAINKARAVHLIIPSKHEQVQDERMKAIYQV